MRGEKTLSMSEMDPEFDARPRKDPQSKKLIETINSVQEALEILNRGKEGKVTQLDLPRIAVVGGQSAGKSSVLESIVGFDFLPRGSGIVTRRPLIIQLVTAEPGDNTVATLKKDSSSGMKESVFSGTHISGVRDAIISATEGHPDCQNGGISSEPMVLEIRSPDVLNLTLIDLPGMVVYARQSTQIKENIERLVRKFVENENTIILAVTPANADLANSDAVRVATEADPEGKRTLGVLTKVDIMDRGTEKDAMEIIEKTKDGDIPFSWIPVKNRSQADINERKSVQVQRLEEEDFFDKWFEELGWGERCGAGIDYLSKTLHSILVRHIKEKLPQIERDVNHIYAKKSGELEALKAGADQLSWKRKACENIQRYSDKLVKQLQGRDHETPFGTLSVGAKLVDIYKGDFVRQMQDVDPFQDLDDETLLTIIKNTRAHDDGSFLPHEALKQLVRKNINVLLPIALSCVGAVHDELRGHAQLIRVEGNSRRLVDWLEMKVVEHLDEWKENTSTFVTGLIKMEKRINPDHPDYFSQVELNKMLADRENETRHSMKSAKKSFRPYGTFQLRVSHSTFSQSQEGEYALRDGSLVDISNEKKRIELKTLQQMGLVRFSDNMGQTPYFASEKDGQKGAEWAPLFDIAPAGTGKSGISCWCFSALKKSILDELKASSTVQVNSSGRNLANQYRPSLFGEVNVIKGLLREYFDKVIRVKVIDSVPKAIAFHFVDVVEEELWRKLNDAFLDLADDENDLKDLMGLSPEEEKRQNDCEEAMSKLQKAMVALKDLRTLELEYARAVAA